MGPNLRAMDPGSPPRPDPPLSDSGPPQAPLDPEEFFFPPKRRPSPGCLGRGGCGMGCLGGMIVLLFVMGGMMAWLLGEARIPAAESLVGPQTVSFSIVHLDEQDAGMRALLDNSMQQLRTTFIDHSTLPGGVKEILRKLAPDKVHSFLPIQVVVSCDLLPGESAAAAPAAVESPGVGAPGVASSGAPSVASSGAAGVASSGAPGVASSGAPGVASSGAPGVASSGAPGVASSGAPGVASSGAPGVASSGAPGVASSGAPGGTTSGAPGAAASAKGGATPTVIVSFGRFKGLSDFMFRAITSSREEGSQLMGYRGFEILVVPPVHPGDIACIGHVRNNYIFSSRLEGVKLAIDRLLSGSGAFGGRPEMGRMFADLDAHQDLVGVISSDGNQLRHFVDDIERAQDPNGPRLVPQGIDGVLADVRQVGWEIDVLSQDEFTLHLRVDCTDERAAASIVHVLDEIGRDVKAAKLGETTSAPHANGRIVDVAWRVHNLLPESH